ncbi:unnamed protein product [Cyclocybe aegerita]|uniref:Peptidase M43 pregnancy-associated plasma-A domain-containing protein n=1 Tax=Cyclocybe aegerita TaxID=1973307 RepID=A0A8S0WYY0_CYCAE|nr:unnamed protein product [Cyclocybe aegerita]
MRIVLCPLTAPDAPATHSWTFTFRQDDLSSRRTLCSAEGETPHLHPPTSRYACNRSRRSLFGVGRGCGTTISAEKLAAAQKHFQDHRVHAPAGLLKAKPLDVYFHVIYANGTLEGGAVPDSFITDQIQVLNEDFASSGLGFNLKSVARIENAEWFSKLGPYDTADMDTEMKKTYRQGGAGDLNVYTVGFEVGEAQGLLGYATFPSDYKEFPTDDGVVMLHSSLPGGSSAPYNLGRTLTHEVGHWVGLYHTFEGGCNGGDEVEDTAPEDEPAFGCPAGRDTCPGGGADPIHNFMDYSDDSCMTSFTPGQITRFKDQIATYRSITDEIVDFEA